VYISQALWTDDQSIWGKLEQTLNHDTKLLEPPLYLYAVPRLTFSGHVRLLISGCIVDKARMLLGVCPNEVNPMNREPELLKDMGFGSV
jgi:hypothetical protein